jgi:glycosyltransferase involved in cell wall biosynthesis
MRILHVNKFLYRRGGAEGYMEDVAALQRGAGHDVEFFGMTHPENEPRTYERFFPPYIEMEPAPSGLGERAKSVARMIWSTSSRRGMEAVVDEFRPDVVHLHNIYHQLSPSILRPLAARRIPSVMTLHDYKLACPTYQFLGADGEVCERCIGRKFHECTIHACKDGSRLASLAMTVELSIHTWAGAYKPVSRFVCPSRFMVGRMIAGEVFPERLRHVPHFVITDGVAPKASPGGPLVYAGRLSHEKAVDVLIDAVGRLPDTARLVVAGDGPDAASLRAQAERVAPGKVEFVGRLAKPEVHELLRSAVAACVPSRWYENQPLSVLEAFAAGVPVVGTAIGGIPELVDDGTDGWLAAVDDADDLAAVLARVMADPDAAFQMGKAARVKAETHHAPDVHVAALDEIYSEITR